MPPPASSTSRRGSPSVAGESGSEAKRRKLRKGTRSCWECKRRKVRCTFAFPSDTVCVECRRRGTNCLGQEMPVEDTVQLPNESAHRQMSDRMIRVESMIEHLVRVVGSSNATAAIDDKYETNREPLQDASQCPTGQPEHSRSLTSYWPSPEEPAQLDNDVGDEYSSQAAVAHGQSNATSYERISKALHAALPSSEDFDILRQASAHVSIYFDQVMFLPYSELERGEFEGNRALLGTPAPDTHPVLLAKYMFDLATALHYLDPETYGQLDRLSQKPHVLAKRLADTARRLVTTDDELLGTVEGLQCVMMEGIYQANCGNLRRAWIAFRRAMVAGQLMGIHRPLSRPLKLIDPSTRFDAQFFWSRIVYTDRFHCLMLGLPQGSSDRSMASESALARDTPLGRLERIHCAIASRILERNDADTSSLNPATLKQIDHDLQEAAKVMPSSWWLAPNLPAAVVAAGKGDQSVFWEMLRLVTQLYHYNLLNQLYLPYILRFNPAESWPAHFQLTCINASREVLSRSIAFRSFNRIPFCCRAADFFALVAALTILLVHLDSHRRRHSHDDTSPNSGNLDVLAHQHLGDRALLEQALENMNVLARISNDTLSAKSAGLLRRLLDIEAEAAEGETYCAQRESSAKAAQGQAHDDAHVLRIGIPHFGTIRITREGGISKMTPPNVPPTAIPAPLPSAIHYDGSSSQPEPRLAKISSSMPVIETSPRVRYMPSPYNDTTPTQLQQQPNLFEESNPAAGSEELAFHHPSMIDDAFQQYLNPGPTATFDEWVLQGADTAFFNNLLGESIRDANRGTPW
ncbi:hypothetical protein GQX73_g5697 [Xylaria multiplex]|uniref:Zn(2)-C6 fungal-type domain-containing protein n=1 Tax=Xylaria multiplex TaxID=323545 RepID=A0A7C8MTC8_9PEZI|nr:hypothetical protein GQX73_g5697 [Xylaria multiplex]